MGGACPRFMGVMSQVPGLSAARGGSWGSPGCAFGTVNGVLEVFNPKPGFLESESRDPSGGNWESLGCNEINCDQIFEYEINCDQIFVYEINCDPISCGELETRINFKGRTGPLLEWC